MGMFWRLVAFCWCLSPTMLAGFAFHRNAIRANGPLDLLSWDLFALGLTGLVFLEILVRATKAGGLPPEPIDNLRVNKVYRFIATVPGKDYVILQYVDGGKVVTYRASEEEKKELSKGDLFLLLWENNKHYRLVLFGQ